MNLISADLGVMINRYRTLRNRRYRITAFVLRESLKSVQRDSIPKYGLTLQVELCLGPGRIEID